MAQKEIEIILARQLAEHLATSVFIVDPDGLLLYFNEPAEKILGRRFGETGEMPASVWSALFEPMDEQGRSIDPHTIPLMQTLTTHRPAHGVF